MKIPVNMANDPVPRVMIRLAIPLMVSLFFQNLYSYVNTIFISWLGEIPLAAISLSLPLTYIALSLGKGIAMGSVVLISHDRGAGNEADVQQMGRSILPLMTLVMICFLPLMVPELCRIFFTVLGADLVVMEHIYGFTFWLVAGFPVMGYVMAAEALFIVKGDTVTPMKGMILGNVLNMALDPLLIFGLNLGTAGATLGTLFGQIAAGIYLSWRLQVTGYSPLSIIPTLGMIKYWRRIASQGMFIASSYLVSPFGLILLNGVLIQFGAVAVGAWNMMSRTEMMVMLPIMGMSNALATFISFNAGKQDYIRIRSGIKFFFTLSLGIVLPVMLLFVSFPHMLNAVFRPPAELRELSGYAIQASGIAIVFSTILFAFYGTVQGLKRPALMMVVSFAYIIVLRVPLAYWIGSYWGERGVFWSHPLATIGAAMIALTLLLRLLRTYQVEIRG
ncbi:MAG: Na+-driven multidrug efflux pump-like protein [Firmicutes bacterium]|nr:Na+-driven multidrug efflux pump-like protein [Bacillota bacterium]